MKKLVCAAFVAVSMFALAEEAAKDAAPAVVPVPVNAAKVAKRPSLTPEQMAERRAIFEKRLAERKAAEAAKMLEVVKKYVPEEEKAKALVKELQDLMDRRRNRMMQRPLVRPAKPAAEAK